MRKCEHEQDEDYEIRSGDMDGIWANYKPTHKLNDTRVVVVCKLCQCLYIDEKVKK